MSGWSGTIEVSVANAEVTDEETLEIALEWLRESYWLKAPARLRGAVEDT